MFRIVCDPSSGSNELCFTEITLSGSQIFFVCLVGVWQRNPEPAVCVCARYDGLGTTSRTRGRVRELKNAYNSVTVQNRTHVYMNIFDHKDLGNHLLQ